MKTPPSDDIDHIEQVVANIFIGLTLSVLALWILWLGFTSATPILSGLFALCAVLAIILAYGFMLENQQDRQDDSPPSTLK